MPKWDLFQFTLKTKNNLIKIVVIWLYVIDMKLQMFWWYCWKLKVYIFLILYLHSLIINIGYGNWSGFTIYNTHFIKITYQKERCIADSSPSCMDNEHQRQLSKSDFLHFCIAISNLAKTFLCAETFFLMTSSIDQDMNLIFHQAWKGGSSKLSSSPVVKRGFKFCFKCWMWSGLLKQTFVLQVKISTIKTSHEIPLTLKLPSIKLPVRDGTSFTPPTELNRSHFPGHLD